MKLGILGAGTIVPAFLEASSQIEDFDIQSIYGQVSDLIIMQQFSKEYDIQSVYTDWNEFITSDIEIVYIALPNHLHHTFALKALQHGKHVILEKPFTATYRESKELIETAHKENVFIFEAISNQFLPNYEKTNQLIPTLGNIKIVQLNYSQYSRRYDEFKKGHISPVLDSTKAGGALMDLNIYNIHFIVGLFGEPQNVEYYPNIEQDVDTSGILILEYKDFQCVCVGAKDSSSPPYISIQGDKGYIHSDTPANQYNSFSYCLEKTLSRTFELNNKNNRLYYELKKFAELLKENNKEEFERLNKHTLAVMNIIRKIKER